MNLKVGDLVMVVQETDLKGKKVRPSTIGDIIGKKFSIKKILYSDSRPIVLGGTGIAKFHPNELKRLNTRTIRELIE